MTTYPLLSKLLLVITLLSLFQTPYLSAAPTNGDKFLFIGAGNTADYASDFASLVNNDSSLGITITAEGYDSYNMVDDYYKERHFEPLSVGVPTELNNNFTNKLGENFDYIVILGDPYNLKNYPALLLESVHLIKDWIRWQNKSSTIILAGIWDGSDELTRQSMSEKLYRIGDAMETEIAPAHLAWNDITNDTSISVTHTELISHTAETRYTLASSLYAHYFKKLTGNATFTLTGLSTLEKSRIDTHAYNNWVFAQNIAQYSGEYTESYFRPGQFAIGSNGSYDLSAMGFKTSTENAIVGTMGATNDSTNTRTWVSGTQAQNVLGGSNYDLMLVRWSSATSSSNHQQWIDWSKNPNINFVGYKRHLVGSGTNMSLYPNGDLLNIDYAHRYSVIQNESIRTSIGGNYGWSIPVVEGFGRFVEERLKSAPYANDAPTYWGQHLGRYYEGWMSSMLYILSTGNKPAYKPVGWTRVTTDNQPTYFQTTVNAEDWNFGIDKAYEMMMQYGKLEGANGEMMPVRANYAPLALDQSVNVDENTTSDVIIPLVASDKESSPLSYSIVDAPDHGSISVSGSIITYTPAPNYNSGNDDFIFKVNDGVLNSNLATVSITVGTFSPAPEINVLGNGMAILDGSTQSSAGDFTEFSDIIVQHGIATTRTFTILNSGLADLDLSGLITVTGVDSADFSITQQPAIDPLSSNLSTSFEITFLASSAGAKNAVIHIPSNDSDEADFDFAISGEAISIELEYVNTSFAETGADDGSIDSAPVIINIQYETFSGLNGRDLVADGDVTTSNLPLGLVPVITKVSDTQLSVVLTGSATYHEASQSVDALAFHFQDSAFSTYPSLGIINRDDLSISFTGDIPYVSNSNDSGAGSLRRVTAGAPEGSTVLFLPFVTSVNLTTTPVLIDKNMTIDGGGSVTVDGGLMTSHFLIVGANDSDISVTFQNLTLNDAKNTSDGTGGSIHSQEDLTLINCVFNRNSSDFNGKNRGGAIYSRGNLTINGCVFSNNECAQNQSSNSKQYSYGGVIDQSGYTLMISDSQFSNNTTTARSYKFGHTGVGYGGALYLANVEVAVISNSEFIDNRVTSIGSTAVGDAYGGAIYSEWKSGDGDLTIDQVTFSGNSSETPGTTYGGALCFVVDEMASAIRITNTTIYDNLARSTRSGKKSQGAAVYINLINADPLLPSAVAFIYNSTISSNSTLANTDTDAVGGGVYLRSGPLNVESTIIGDNSAEGDGQDVMLHSDGVLVASYSLIESSDGGHGVLNGVDDNIVGQDALLGSLSMNGGSTQTIKLLAGSPALDAGSNSLAHATDQRGVGFNRSFAGGVDIGAFELSWGTFAIWALDSGLTGGDALGDADPDGDGVVNLMEYFVGSDPQASGSVKISSVIDGSDRLGISYQSNRADEPADLIVTVEGSSDLGLNDPWAPVSATHSVSGTDPYLHTWTQDTPVGVAERAFIRIRITQQ